VAAATMAEAPERTPQEAAAELASRPPAGPASEPSDTDSEADVTTFNWTEHVEHARAVLAADNSTVPPFWANKYRAQVRTRGPCVLNLGLPFTPPSQGYARPADRAGLSELGRFLQAQHDQVLQGPALDLARVSGAHRAGARTRMSAVPILTVCGCGQRSLPSPILPFLPCRRDRAKPPRCSRSAAAWAT